MEETRKKLRVCLICVVAVAVIVGMVYYFADFRTDQEINGGTLVRASVQVGRGQLYAE